MNDIDKACNELLNVKDKTVIDKKCTENKFKKKICKCSEACENM